MNWLLGGRNDDGPETPVHKWAFNAFKGVLIPETACYQGQLECDTPGMINSGIGILKTPGQLKEKRKTTVTFHASVKTPPKKNARSGLPNVFPGKFPSPWTPRSIIFEQEDAATAELGTIDSPSLVNGRNERPRSSNSLKTLSLRLEEPKNDHHAQSDGFTRVARGRERVPHSNASSRGRKVVQAAPLSWDVEKGFEEVLECIEKNNAYLQTLINEMQESCSQVDESFNENHSLTDFEVTANLDEPRSRSGQYWKSKFLEFNVLTECVKKEQNNMERVLHTLRASVEDRNNSMVENWKDRYDLLKEELDRERKVHRNSAQVRELRDLKKLVRELQSKGDQEHSLRKQLDIADLEIKELRSQVQTTRQALPATNPRSSNIRNNDLPSLKQPDLSSDIAKGVSASSDRPLSSTSRRLARARAQTHTADPIHTSTNHLEALIEEKTTESGVRLENRTTYRRFGSRTENPLMVRQDVSLDPPVKFNKTFERTGKDPSFSPPPIIPQVSEISPRPKFATLDSNRASDKVAMDLAAKIATKEPDQVATDEEVAKKRLAREAAQRRLDQRKAERALRAKQSVTSATQTNKENIKIN